MNFDPISITLIVLSLGAYISLLVPLFIQKESRIPYSQFLSSVTLIVSLSVFVTLMSRISGQTSPVFSLDSISFFTGALILLSALLAILVGAPYLEKEGINHPIEFQFLILCSTAGALVLATSIEFINAFIGLEIMSICIYCLAGAARKKRASAEASLKYLVLGCVASAFTLYGFTFLYAATGSTSLATVGQEVANAGILMPLSLVLILIGMAFKIGCPPAHFWVPDVYQGSPTPSTLFMSCVVKVASFAFLLRILTTTYAHFLEGFVWLFWLAAILAMTAGNCIALRQRSVKRMLGYSSIAHTGYILAAFAPLPLLQQSTPAILFYLFIYCLMSVGSFAIVTVVGSNRESDIEISALSGLGRTKPALAVCMTLFLLGLAGLPPSLSGLIGKTFLVNAALDSGMIGLVMIFLINSGISCFYYLRAVVAIWFVPADSESAQSEIFVSPGVGGVILACVFGVIALGIYPEPLLKAGQVVSQVGKE